MDDGSKKRSSNSPYALRSSTSACIPQESNIITISSHNVPGSARRKRRTVRSEPINYQDKKRRVTSRTRQANTQLRNPDSRNTEHSEFRVVIVGKTGVGKSSLGNSLIGKDIFITSKSLSSKTQICKIDKAQTSIGRLKVVDTPGLFDTAIPNGEKIKDLVKCVGLLPPGPHVFIFVLKAETTTQNDEETIRILKKTFVEDIMRHVIVVFTRKDQLTDTKPEEFIQDLPKFLEQLLNEVNDRRQFICNLKTNSSHAQDVENVLTLIKNTVQQNGGKYYTPEVFQAVEEAIQREILEKQKREKKSAEECRQEIETDIVNNEPRTVHKIIDVVKSIITRATPHLCDMLFQYVKMKMQQIM